VHSCLLVSLIFFFNAGQSRRDSNVLQRYNTIHHKWRHAGVQFLCPCVSAFLLYSVVRLTCPEFPPHCLLAPFVTIESKICTKEKPCGLVIERDYRAKNTCNYFTTVSMGRVRSAPWCYVARRQQDSKQLLILEPRLLRYKQTQNEISRKKCTMFFERRHLLSSRNNPKKTQTKRGGMM